MPVEYFAVDQGTEARIDFKSDLQLEKRGGRLL